MIKAVIEFSYKDEKIARTVARLLEIDNKIAPRKLRLTTINEKNRVITKLEHENTGTFTAAVDDLLFSEKLIRDLLDGFSC
jgi:hypothetical protein